VLRQTSISERQRLEKLGRRRLRVEYGEQTARETKRDADAEVSIFNRSKDIEGSPNLHIGMMTLCP